MNRHQKNCILAIFLAVFGLASVASAEKRYKVAFSPADLYLGHISYVEIKNDGQDPMILREGQSVPELAVLNAPIGPGDVIRTSGVRRCEVQFDTATLIRLDTDTELKIETILAQTLSARERTTNLVLAKGQIYIMYKEYDSRELFQVMTPAAAIKFSQDTVALVKAAADGSADLQVKRGKANALYGSSADKAKRSGVGKLARLIISKDGQAQKVAYAADTDFESWNEEINASFSDLHRGLSFLPAPVQHYSAAIIAWAEKYSTRYGRWVYDRLYGYVWCPDTNDIYPSTNWQPYFYGHWIRAYDQMFWVSDEPWGWVPYHLGVWVWDKGLGWIWVPGSVFAAAWVGWGYFNGYYSWWSYGFNDWWYWSRWGNYYYYNPYMYTSYYYAPDKTLGKISKNQLKKPAAPLPIPNDLTPVYKRVAEALKNHDPRLVASLKQSAKHIVFVHRADIHFPNIAEKAVPFSQVTSAAEASNARPSQADKIRLNNPAVAAAWDWKKNIQSSTTESESAARQVRGRNSQNVTVPARSAAMRSQVPAAFHPDWNPDLRAVAPFGATIRYSSRTNEVQCPELGLTSRTAPFYSLSPISHGHGSFGGGSHFGSSPSSSSSGAGKSAAISGGQSSGTSAGSSSRDSGSSSHSSSGNTKKD